MSSRCNRIPFYEFLDLSANVVKGYPAENLSVEPKKEGPLGFAEPDGILGNCVEHRLQVEGGTADYLQHLGGGGLLFQ
jgi:hypothetical protein